MIHGRRREITLVKTAENTGVHKLLPGIQYAARDILVATVKDYCMQIEIPSELSRQGLKRTDPRGRRGLPADSQRSGSLEKSRIIIIY